MDLILSCVGMVLFCPVFLAISVAIKIDSEGPVFYKQERVGKGGKRFTFYKFRSMLWKADEVYHKNYVAAYINGSLSQTNENPESGIYKLVEDPRVTRVGRFLRKTSLDELPQLLNVIKGDMSLVGPRPPIPYELDHYQDWHKRRLDVKPGLTGLWQIRGRSMLTFDQMVELDLQYIESWSLWTDVRILIKTIPAVLSAKGAY